MLQVQLFQWSVADTHIYDYNIASSFKNDPHAFNEYVVPSLVHVVQWVGM